MVRHKSNLLRQWVCLGIIRVEDDLVVAQEKVSSKKGWGLVTIKKSMDISDSSDCSDSSDSSDRSENSEGRKNFTFIFI